MGNGFKNKGYDVSSSVFARRHDEAIQELKKHLNICDNTPGLPRRSALAPLLAKTTCSITTPKQTSPAPPPSPPPHL
jgi:hypothetical protein